MKDVNGIIFAYNSDARLKELVESRTVSSIPFGARYRVIDFMLSNMVNAGVTDVGVIMHENYQSLLDHLGSGKDWDLSRKHGGLRILPPFGYTRTSRTGNYRGKMEALAGVSAYLGRIRQKYVVLADGDLVINLPLRDVFRAHTASGADITAVCAQRMLGDVEESTYFTFGRNGFVDDVAIGLPESHSCQALGIYIMDTKLLENLVSHCASHNLFDFERDVLQPMTGAFKVAGYMFEGYYARLNSTAGYFRRSMELLRPAVRRELFNRERPVLTKIREEASTYYGPSASAHNCLVADGCFIEGRVENSILFRGARVERGANVRNAILMQDCVVLPESHLNYAIADKDVLINKGRMLMGHENYPIAIAKGSVV